MTHFIQMTGANRWDNPLASFYGTLLQVFIWQVIMASVYGKSLWQVFMASIYGVITASHNGKSSWQDCLVGLYGRSLWQVVIASLYDKTVW